MIKIEIFNVRIVNKGDKYGRDDCLTNTSAQMVEFYDSRYQDRSFGERGQFVSRYFAETLRNDDFVNGLCLDGGVPEWTVSAEGMKQVQEFLA